MNTVLLIVPVGVEYPASLSTVDWIEAVGFILRLKTQVFSSNLYNHNSLERHTPLSMCSLSQVRRSLNAVNTHDIIYIHANGRETRDFPIVAISYLEDAVTPRTLISNTSIEVCLSIYLVYILEERKERKMNTMAQASTLPTPTFSA